MHDDNSYFGGEFYEWVVCLISDNCSTNQKISRDSGKPLVECLNHKLNLEVNKMINRMTKLNNQISTVHATMSFANAFVKSAAILRNLTDLHAVIDYAKRWSGKN